MSESNILIIDDNKDLADGLGMILEDEGYQVTLAYNGPDGIRSFNTGHFDMVLVANTSNSNNFHLVFVGQFKGFGTS